MTIDTWYVEDATSDRRDRRVGTWLLGVLIFVALRLAGDHMAITTAEGWLWITRIAEFWLVAGILMIGVSGFDWSELPLSAHRARAAALSSVIALMFVGHLVFLEGLYPFVSWPMYTSTVSSLEYGEVAVETSEGERILLPLHDLPTLSREPRAVKDALWQLGVRASEGNREAETTLRETISVILDDNPIDAKSVTIRTCTVTDPTHANPANCATVFTLELSPST